MDDASLTEVAVVGCEGIVGVALFMGGETSLSQARVESAGHAYRMQGKLLRKEFHRGGALQRLLLLYTQALGAEMAQTLACSRKHSLNQQFCRWLLLRFDRLTVNDLAMSQETIARLLGVRRSGISEVASKLQNLGLIEYDRAHISLLDRPGLEAQSCECYAAIKDEFSRLLSK